MISIAVAQFPKRSGIVLRSIHNYSPESCDGFDEVHEMDSLRCRGVVERRRANPNGRQIDGAAHEIPGLVGNM
jgi:hypothetical protein